MEGRTRAVALLLLLGLTSMLADFTYEGGRSVIGPYMGFLGASAVVVGVVSAGDMLGYLLRIVSGYAASRVFRGSTRILWLFTFTGYALNFSIPLLALAGSPWLALLLVMIERAGKGIRAPARDALLKSVTEGYIGKGWTYAIHEVLDQLGAVAGPLAVAYSIAKYGRYREAYVMLAPAAAGSLLVLLVAYKLWSRGPSRPGNLGSAGLPAGRSGAGLALVLALPKLYYVHWALLGYILSTRSVEVEAVAALYAAAMLADVVLAIPLGALYQRVGVRAFLAYPVLAAASTAATLAWSPLAAALLWGAAMAVEEVVAKSTIAELAPRGEEALWFGLFGGMGGVYWAVGNIAIALLAAKTASAALYIGFLLAASLAAIHRVLSSSARAGRG
ncbi:MAG: hypothetical protein ABWW70_00730 [Thermoproteota archaeon]